MFKLVVLCAFFAAAAAKPGTLIAAPITQYSTYLAPAATTITRQDTSIIHPSPLIYHAPLAYSHFIKKRSPQYAALAYAAPATYYPNYYAASTYNAPLISHASILPAAPVAAVPAVPAVHLIKKRSAPLLPLPATTYYAPSTYAATSPYLASTYTASAPIYTHTPLISQPLYTHFIKKRSAGLLNAYIAAPTSYSHQSRFDLQTTHTPYTSISYAAPITYSSPLAVSHVY